jgi:hypothetical protein
MVQVADQHLDLRYLPTRHINLQLLEPKERLTGCAMPGVRFGPAGWRQFGKGGGTLCERHPMIVPHRLFHIGTLHPKMAVTPFEEQESCQERGRFCGASVS